MKKLSREIALLLLPVLFIGGVALWREWNDSGRRDGAPEDLRRGEPRVVVETQQVSLTPLDIYRNRSVRVRIQGWLSGDWARVPVGGQRFTHSVLEKGILQYRVGEKWLPFVSEKKNVEIRTEPDTARADWYRLPEHIVIFDLTKVPETAQEVRWGVSYRTFISTSSPTAPLTQIQPPTKQLFVALPLGSSAASFNGSRATNVAITAVKREEIVPDSNPPVLTFVLHSKSLVPSKAGVELFEERLFSSDGRWIGECGTSTSITTEGATGTTTHLRNCALSTLDLSGPITFQALASVDEGWPSEINILIPEGNAMSKPELSQLPFQRGERLVK